MKDKRNEMLDHLGDKVPPVSKGRLNRLSLASHSTTKPVAAIADREPFRPQRGQPQAAVYVIRACFYSLSSTSLWLKISEILRKI